MGKTTTEPWLRGPLAGVNPLVMPVFFSFAQVREDLAFHLGDSFTREQVWRTVGSASLGFHLKHIAGSVDRLSTYLMGGQLSDGQLESLNQEYDGNEDLPEVVRQIEESLQRCEARLRTLDSNALYETRSVGREALPTTVIGLVVHLAEHTQRHLGQAITLSKVLRQPA